MRKHRCSSLPRFVECPSSAMEPRHRIDSSGPVATEGTAAHDGMEYVVAGKEVPIDDIARKHGVDVVTLRVLIAYGRQAWKKLQELLPSCDPEAEVHVESSIVSGTADVLYSDGNQLVVIDWKSGYVRRHHLMQLAGYGHGAVAERGMPSSGKVTVITAWLRFGEMEVKQLTATDLAQFETTIQEASESIGKVWNPGEACDYCPMWTECEARADVSRAAAQSLEVIDSTALTPQVLAELYPKAKILAKALELYDKALRTVVNEQGELDLPDGRTLVFTEAPKESIDDIPKTWKILREDFGFTLNHFAEVVKMSKTSVLKVLGAKTPKGHKKGEGERLMAVLKEAGALKETVIRTLQAIKKE